MNMSEILRKARGDKTQRDFAEEIGVAYSTYKRYESPEINSMQKHERLIVAIAKTVIAQSKQST